MFWWFCQSPLTSWEQQDAEKKDAEKKQIKTSLSLLFENSFLGSWGRTLLLCPNLLFQD